MGVSLSKAGPSPAAAEFTLSVSLLGSRPERFVFDQPRVLVGRGLDADLRIEHAAIARRQFWIERGVNSGGIARFRIIPREAKNPTYVNDQPAVEGLLLPGDKIAVADIRVIFSLESVKKKNVESAGPGPVRVAVRVFL